MNARKGRDFSLGLRIGELVEVRSAQEILATLDEDGTIDGLPFMPEMLEFCGKRLRVLKLANKTCDTIHYSGSRRMHDTVHLDGARCTGRAHGGCQALCSTFWKEAWLKRVDPNDGAVDPRNTVPVRSQRPPACDHERLLQLTQRRDGTDGIEIRYRCQTTDLLRASKPLPWWDLRQYARDVGCGNVGAADVAKALLFRGFCKLLKVGGYRPLLSAYNRLQKWRGGTPYPYFTGKADKAPRSTLDLQPGELVRVKSLEGILETINKKNRNHGLSFDPEMVRYCGSVRRVIARVERLIDEKSGKMVEIKRDCIVLEGSICHAKYSHGRLFCPRGLYSYWREIWLERLGDPASTPAVASAEPTKAPPPCQEAPVAAAVSR